MIYRRAPVVPRVPCHQPNQDPPDRDHPPVATVAEAGTLQARNLEVALRIAYRTADHFHAAHRTDRNTPDNTAFTPSTQIGLRGS
jgi:hypothetical protein